MRALRAAEPVPWVIAHRGDSASCPQNTIAAFDAALRAPVDGIELDVQLTRDGVAVIHHDRTLRALGGGGKSVAGLDLAEVRALDAGSRFDRRFRGERVPTLEEVLDRYGGRTRLLLEIKSYEGRGVPPGAARRLAGIVARAVRRRRLEGSAPILSFDPAVLDAVREEAPRIRTVLNLARRPRLDAAAWRRLDPLFALSIDVRAVTPLFVREAHRRGKPVLVYTCNRPSSALAALRAGADALMSDRPGWLAELLAVHPR